MPPRDTTSTPSEHLPSLSRGAIVRVSPDRLAADAAVPSNQRDLPTASLVFQYNPNTVTFSRAARWEARSRRNARIGSPQDVRARSGSGSSHLLAESETIGFKLIFDATEDILRGQAANGIVPELSFLQNVSLGRSRARGEVSDDLHRTSAVRPDELILVLGHRRAFPVVMTNLTIVEQKHTPRLVPIRAEVDLKFNMLEPVDVTYNTWVSDAFDQVFENRRSLSAEIESPSDVGTILDGVLSAAATNAAANEEG